MDLILHRDRILFHTCQKIYIIMKPKKFFKHSSLLLCILLWVGQMAFGQAEISTNPADYPGVSVSASSPTSIRFNVDCGTGIPYSGNLVVLNPVGGATYTLSTNIIGLQPGGNLSLSFPSGTDFRIDDDGTPGFTNAIYSFQVDLEEDGSDVDSKTIELYVRCPLKIDFVLDRSGSMLCLPSTPVGTWPCTPHPAISDARWGVLSASVSSFLAPLLLENFPGDQFGVTLFHGASAADWTVGGLVAGLNDLDATNVGHVDNVATGLLNGVSPGGGTPMGRGVTAGTAKVGPASSTTNRVIFLFTDGEQNGDANFLVAPGGTALNNGTPLNNGTGSESIRIYPVATIAHGSTVSILNDIANSNGGDLALAAGGTSDPTVAGEILAAFNAEYADMLADNSPQLSAYVVKSTRRDSVVLPRRNIVLYRRQLASVAGSSSYTGLSQSFTVNRNYGNLIFQVTALEGGGGDDQTFFFIVEKDGKYFIPSILTPKYGIFSLNDLYSNPKKYKVNRSDIPADWSGEVKVHVISFGEDGQSRPFYLSSIIDDHLFDFDLGLGPDGEQLQVEEPLALSAALSYEGKALTGAKVSVILQKPGDDIGDLLARLEAGFDPADPDVAGSIGIQKLAWLQENDPDFLKRTLPQDQIINLKDNGNGKYSFTYSNTDVTGHYKATFLIEADDPKFGAIRRKVPKSIYIMPGDIELDESAVNVQGSGNTTVVQLRPAYKVGTKTRFVGPAYQDLLTLSVNGKPGPRANINPDGTYSFDVPGGGSTNIELNFGGQQLHKGSAETCCTGGDDPGENFLEWLDNWLQDTLGLPAWLVGLIILLLGIIIAWWRRRKSS
jgi:hypothetical protein